MPALRKLACCPSRSRSPVSGGNARGSVYGIDQGQSKTFSGRLTACRCPASPSCHCWVEVRPSSPTHGGGAAFALHAIRQTLASSATLQISRWAVSPRFPSETDAIASGEGCPRVIAPKRAPPHRPFGPTLPKGESEERRSHALTQESHDLRTDVRKDGSAGASPSRQRGHTALTVHAVRQTLASSATLQISRWALAGVSPRFPSETDA